MPDRGRAPSSECKHQRTRSTLMWPPDANTVTCEDCGEVVTPPARVTSRPEAAKGSYERPSEP